MRPGGLEPPTYGSGSRRSIRLSYERISPIFDSAAKLVTRTHIFMFQSIGFSVAVSIARRGSFVQIVLAMSSPQSTGESRNGFIDLQYEKNVSKWPLIGSNSRAR